jgi:hypothetical protein
MILKYKLYNYLMQQKNNKCDVHEISKKLKTSLNKTIQVLLKLASTHKNIHCKRTHNTLIFWHENNEETKQNTRLP